MSNKKEGSSGSFDKLNTDNNNNKKNLSKQNSEVENGLNKLENNKSNTEINLIKQISTEGESYEIEYSIDQIQNPIDKSSDLKQFNLERIRKLQTFDLEYKNKYYEDYFNSYSIDSYENQEISLIQFNQNTIIDFKNSENILERTKSSSGSGCGNQEIPTPINFSSTDGYGHANIERAFEILKGIDISSKDDLGGNLWGLDNIGAPEVWTSTGCFSGSTGKDVVVAVLDTGLDYSHSEFSGRIVDGYDFIDNDNIAQDVHGHGTHCSGTILGANDGVGITGVAYDAKIMPIKVLNDSGRGSIAGIVAGMRWAVDNGADVLNLSLGGGAPNSDYLDALKYAADNGVVVAMASGNSSSSAPLWPARYATDYGIAVGAVDINKNDAYFSNRAGNTTMDYVSAPGVNVYSSLPGGGYESWNGTSMAAPHVAGMAALLKSYDKTLTPLQIETLISASASNSDSNSSNNSNNYFESNSEFNMFYSKDFDDLFFESNELISGYEYSFDSNSSGSDYLDWALDLIGENNEKMYIAGTDGFYENQSKNKIEELNSFIDEINQGVEDKEEEIAYAGGTDGFYENQSKNKIEELNSFIDEINQGVEDKEEEIAYAGGTDGFYENQ
ncbi:S8 family peptidase, partial [Prochlorococcus marinus]